MTGTQRKNRFRGAADAICRSRFCPYLFSFLLSAFGLGIVFLLSRGALSYLYETQAAGWYGTLRALGSGNALAVISESDDLALLSFSFNPLNRLIALFPFSSTLSGVLFFNAIKVGLAAAAFAYFLKLRETDDLPSVLFSVLYALSSYSLVSQLTGVAADALIVLPLLLAGIERIASRRGFALFSVSLALCAVVSFRTLFGFFVFSVLWLFVIRFTRGNVKAKPLFFDLLLIVLSVPAAILFSAPVLFPAFDRLLLSFLDLSFKQSYNLIEFFGKMLPATYDGLYGNRFPYLFIGMLPLLLLPIFFLSKKIPVREKVSFGVLTFVLYFTFSVNVISAFWDIFADPDGYSYTAALVFPALFLAISARAYGKADRKTERALVAVALVLTALISILQKMDLYYMTEEEVKVVWFSDINSVWVPLPFLILGCAGILAVIRYREAHPERPIRLVSFLSLFLMLVTVLDVSVSGAAFAGVIAKKEGTDVSEKEGNHAYVSSYYAAYASGIAACKVDDPLYRAEKFDRITENDASYLGYASLSSLSPEILSAFGIEYDEDGNLKEISSPLSLSLFGVRYAMTHEKIETKGKEIKRLKQTTGTPAPTYDTPAAFPESLSYLFDQIYMDETGTVYENAYVLPLVFRAAAIPDESILTEVNATPYSRINKTFRALTGDDTLSLYVPAQVTAVLKPYCTIVESEHPGYVGYERNSSNGTASVQYQVTVSHDGPLFCSFPTEYPLTIADIRVNGRSIGHAYTETETDLYDVNGQKIKEITPNARFVGNFSAGDTVTVAVAFGAGIDGTVFYLPENVPFVYEIDFEALERTVASLTSSNAVSVKNGALVITGSDNETRPSVVSTVPASVAKTNAAENAPFLGYFVAGNAVDAKKVTVSPALGGTSVYLLSLVGALLLFVLLFFESISDRGRKIPFFTREAGGETEGST
ncbi:MAG: YfhO family protein [Clostridia bacterium]|nr:YfhO family protein [Clostridia bacterium]